MMLLDLMLTILVVVLLFTCPITLIPFFVAVLQLSMFVDLKKPWRVRKDL